MVDIEQNISVVKIGKEVEYGALGFIELDAL
jgi:hypothetical protein